MFSHIMLKTILWRWRFRKLSPQGSEPRELVSTLTSSQATFFKLWVAAHLSVIKSVYWIEENQVGYNRKYYSKDTFVNLFLPVGCGQTAWKSAALNIEVQVKKVVPQRADNLSVTSYLGTWVQLTVKSMPGVWYREWPWREMGSYTKGRNKTYTFTFPCQHDTGGLF